MPLGNPAPLNGYQGVGQLFTPPFAVWGGIMRGFRIHLGMSVNDPAATPNLSGAID
jgi:hypothetical protein